MDNMAIIEAGIGQFVETEVPWPKNCGAALSKVVASSCACSCVYSTFPRLHLGICNMLD